MGNSSTGIQCARSDAGKVPPPLKPTPQTRLPRALTFFLTSADRTAVLKALRLHDQDRASALLLALNINTKSIGSAPEGGKR